VSSLLDPHRDTAQRLVTAVLTGDRDLAVTLVADVDHPRVLALVLADLCAHVHHSWANAVDFPHDRRLDAWRWLLLDVETWRSRMAEQGGDE
jgi:hypothetical protein